MSRNALALIDYLGHILEAIERIQEYVDDIDEVSFLSNRLRLICLLCMPNLCQCFLSCEVGKSTTNP
jgi:hypothetical protein